MEFLDFYPMKNARIVLALSLGLVTTTLLANPVRSTPRRPVPAADAKAKVNANAPAPAAKAAKIAGVPKPLEYVRIEEVAARHGLAVSWLQPQKRVLLRNEKDQVEIEAGSREMRVNGLRVFLGDPSRWASDRELEWRALRPELVVEIAYDT